MFCGRDSCQNDIMLFWWRKICPESGQKDLIGQPSNYSFKPIVSEWQKRDKWCIAMNLLQNRHYSWNDYSSELLLFICRRVFLSFRLSHVFNETSLSVRNKERGLYREEKSLHHIAMVAKFLDDNKPLKSLKSLFTLIQTSPILFSFI